MRNFAVTILVLFLACGSSFSIPFIPIQTADEVLGCIDVNALNYNPDATVQAEDEWGNIVCTYTSCEDVPFDGCNYAEAFAPWNEFFTATDCINYGGTPCEVISTCDTCAYNEVCIAGLCEPIIPINTSLSRVYINTENQDSINSTDNYVLGTVTVEGGQSLKSDSLISNLDSLTMKIRGRGNSTWALHPKKPFQLKLDDKAEFLDMPNDKKWIFLAEHSDKTMLRNTIAFEMGSNSSLDWSPKGEFAEVYINGLYNGTYNITQKVEEKTNRVNIGDQGFLIEIDQLERLDDDDHYVSSNQFPVLNIKAPDINDIIEDFGIAAADSATTKISAFINEFENALFSNAFTDSINGYSKYIDVESFIDWFLISEIAKNVDSKSFSSIYFNVILDAESNGKIKMGPLWDFDISFGNNDYSDCQFHEGWWVKNNPWIARLIQDPVFLNQVRARFDDHFYARKDTILNKISGYANTLMPSAIENNNLWTPYLGAYVWPNPFEGDVSTGNTGADGYTDAVNYMSNWYSQRMEWLNDNLSEQMDIPGCLDANANNYNSVATFQEQDQWNNLVCTYTSCNDVPSSGCMYENAFAPWNDSFSAVDCANYGGLPCELGTEVIITAQQLNLTEGWSIFSTYMLATNMSMDVVLESIVEKVVIVKDYTGSAYLPAYNFNLIGDLTPGDAYFIKLDEEVSLSIDGTYLAPEETPISLNEGWSLLGYLRLEPADAASVLSELNSESDLVIVKDYFGNAYLPEWEFNNIGNLQPGLGYHIKLNNSGVLTYLSNEDSYRTTPIIPSNNRASRFAKTPITDNNMTLIIDDACWDELPHEDAEIAAYDSKGTLVGSAKYTSPLTVLTLWGDDASTLAKDGLTTTETSSYKLRSNNQIKSLAVVEWYSGSSEYSVNSINVVSKIATNILSDAVSTKRALVKVINVLGQEVTANKPTKGNILFKIFNDGTVEKVLK